MGAIFRVSTSQSSPSHLGTNKGQESDKILRIPGHFSIFKQVCSEMKGHMFVCEVFFKFCEQFASTHGCHSGGKSEKCKQCNLIFKCKTRLYSHVMRNQLQIYESCISALICSFAVSCLSNLYLHMCAILGKSQRSVNYVTESLNARPRCTAT